MSELTTSEKLALTAQIAASYVGNNQVPADQLPNLIRSIAAALGQVDVKVEKEPEVQQPAVSIKKSVTPDYIVCLEDGKKLKMLKRHLRATYNMSPEEYRTKWGLPRDYPMVAPNYAARRSEFAKRIGLGRKREEAPAPDTKVRRGAPRGRRKASAG